MLHNALGLSFKRCHKLDTRSDIVDVALDSLGHVVRVARGHHAPGYAVVVLKILGVQQRLDHRSRGVKGEPALVVGMSHARDAVLPQPPRDLLDGLLGWLKEVDDLCRRPVPAVVGRRGVGDPHEVVVGSVQVGLAQADPHRQSGLGRHPLSLDPS